ncbi:MAG: class I SAM-dependent methyltransferase [Geminicoccales bacterium]
MLADRPAESILLDVGAHHGSTLAPFAARGWHVFAFEPDPSNRKVLTARFGAESNVTIDGRAVSDAIAEDIPFFASEESSGISSLHRFHPSHREVARVATTTLAAFAEEQSLEAFDVLKVDTEGHELAVLRGLNWERARPSVVLCEFEDRKTARHDFDQLALFLVKLGYTVFVSEWHPIVRYGVRHDWRRLARYPCRLIDPLAWGNLMAFREAPDLEVVQRAARRWLSIASPGLGARRPLWAAADRMWLTALRLRERVARVPGARRAYHAARRLVAFFEGRWPPVVAVLAVVLQAVALAGAPYAWIVGALAALLFLLLIAHAGMSGREAATRALRSAAKADATTQESAKRIGSLEAELRKVAATARGAAEQVRGLDVEDLIATQGKLNTANVGHFQPFNRRLTGAHIERLREAWLPALGLELDARALAYLAHRVCLVEDRCVGRLATSVEDMLLRILVAQAVRRPRLAVLEIGVLFGVGLAALYETCFGRFEQIRLAALDPLEGYYDRGAHDVATAAPVSRAVFERNMRRCGVPLEDVLVIPYPSGDQRALEAAAAERYDLLIIDGDHGFEGVRSDFERYRPLVEPGGFIVFDDFGAPEWPDIKAFVNAEVRVRADLALVGADWRTAVFRVDAQ